MYAVLKVHDQMAQWLSWLERRPVTAEVTGSSPIIGFVLISQYNIVQLNMRYFGWIPEWPKGTDCKSAATRFGGSNPPPSIGFR